MTITEVDLKDEVGASLRLGKNRRDWNYGLVHVTRTASLRTCTDLAMSNIAAFQRLRRSFFMSVTLIASSDIRSGQISQVLYV